MRFSSQLSTEIKGINYLAGTKSDIFIITCQTCFIYKVLLNDDFDAQL